MAHNDSQTTMDAFFDAMEGSENLRITAAGKLQLIDVSDGKWYEVWLDGGVFKHAVTGES